ncbi:hypothetical protein ACLOJK_004987 [Asimina triloba]
MEVLRTIEICHGQIWVTTVDGSFAISDRWVHRPLLLVLRRGAAVSGSAESGDGFVVVAMIDGDDARFRNFRSAIAGIEEDDVTTVDLAGSRCRSGADVVGHAFAFDLEGVLTIDAAGEDRRWVFEAAVVTGVDGEDVVEDGLRSRRIRRRLVAADLLDGSDPLSRASPVMVSSIMRSASCSSGRSVIVAASPFFYQSKSFDRRPLKEALAGSHGNVLGKMMEHRSQCSGGVL